MATAANSPIRHSPLAVTPFDRLLAAGAVAMAAVLALAVARGHDDWVRIPAVIWFHLATIAVAMVLTPVMLLRRRGDRLHRRLGWVWAGAMFLTAIDTLFIRGINRGGFSVIHLLSIWTIIQVPVIILAARRHDAARHKSAVRGMVLGALLVAGFFTLPFGRLLGDWLFG
jgi:uncharacterized membrane protein